MKESEVASGITFGREHEERSASREASLLEWPLWDDSRWRVAALLVVLIALLLRGLVLSSPLVLSGDAQARYVPLASNLWQGHGYSRQSSAPFRPDSFDQPGYPAFLATALDFGRGTLALVSPLQMGLEIAIVGLVFAIAGATGLPRATRLGGLAIALLCPFLPLWSGRAMTEILTTFCLSVLCWLCVQAARDDEASERKIKWWLCAGITGGACLMVRADTLPAVGLMLLASAIAQWFHERRRARRLNFGLNRFGARTGDATRAASGFIVATLALMLVMVPWTGRNFGVFGEFLPLGRVGEQQRNGYVVWLGTWVDDTRYHKPLWWDILKPEHDIRFPVAKITDPFERQVAVRGVELARKRKMFAGDASRIFFNLAARAREENPLLVRVVVPLKRTIMTWLRMPDYTPITAVRGFKRDPARPHIPRPHEEFFIALIGISWYALLIFALIGIGRAIYQRRWLCAPLLGLILGRSLLPFVSGIGTEPRYMIEALPAVFIFAALGATTILHFLSSGRQKPLKSILQVLAEQLQR